MRDRRRRPRLDLAAEVPETAGAAADLGDGVALRQAVAALDPDRREAFVATQVLGLSYVEAAEVIGCPVGTIRSRVARARAELVAGLAERRADAG